MIKEARKENLHINKCLSSMKDIKSAKIDFFPLDLEEYLQVSLMEKSTLNLTSSVKNNLL